jgi:hypothetical protein
MVTVNNNNKKTTVLERILVPVPQRTKKLRKKKTAVDTLHWREDVPYKQA